MDRRTFVGAAGVVSCLGAPVGVNLAAHLERQGAQAGRNELPKIPGVSGERIMLTARAGLADAGPFSSTAWTLNDSLPAPTLHLRRGQNAGIVLDNQLPEPTILHWHGLNVPQEADGHPRFAIAPGERYRYEFMVNDRAGMYWYHPHTHRRTAFQTYMGMAGLIVVHDQEEDALQLPSGENEVTLILQDKRAGRGIMTYDPSMGPDRMLGFLGDVPFGNGVANPTLRVKRAQYRLRILNASNARIFSLGLTNNGLFTLIGVDGGLLDAPASVERIMLGTGERVDVLVDFSQSRPDDKVFLRSFDFVVPGMMMGMGMGRGGGMGRRAGMMRGASQGIEMDMLEFIVADNVAEHSRPLPARLTTLPRHELPRDVMRRTFRFSSMMMNHTINGRQFDMDRIDFRIPLGESEVWSLVNDSDVPHPIHIHAGQFRILSRSGGRNRLMPWEHGLKDTMLVLPRERVDVSVRFDKHPGVFLLHCHNLEHEDMGMMLNFEVIE